MNSLEADLFGYDVHISDEDKRLRQLSQAAAKLNISVVLDYQSDWPVARCPILIETTSEIDGEREYADISFPESDTADRLIQACFADGYWQPCKSEELWINGAPAVTGYLYRVPEV
jgi:hypothetical protein